jgi:hypothetical protein
VNSIRHVHWSGAAEEVLEKLMSNEDAELLLEHFGTIKINLDSNAYLSLDSFIADINLFFN